MHVLINVSFLQVIDFVTIFQVDDQHHGQRLNDIREGLHDMFDDVLDQARGNLAGNDLGRVIIQHDDLHDPIVVPLQPWDQLNADTVMETIEKVLNSHQNLSVDESFDITVGSVDLPKGGARRRITKLSGKKNSINWKKSIVTIVNNDKLCMARAISVSWAKLNRCSPSEWKDITKSRGSNSNLQLILEHRKVPLSCYDNIKKSGRKEQRDMAEAISRMAGVPLDRPASLGDIPAFEDVLGVRIMVVSARLGNKFITTPSTDERPCIYIYLADDEHFHSLTSITAFFSARYFCSSCLKHYNTREKHRCDTSCIICKRQECRKTQSVKCNDCNMECRSIDCYQAHKKVPVAKAGSKKSGPSQCQKWWKCSICYKVVNRVTRKIEQHKCGEYMCSSCEQYVLPGHMCYMRATPFKSSLNANFIFFDFECSQDEVSTCQDGYAPSQKECKDCKSDHKCGKCRKCQNCRTAWCGRTTHRPNYVVAQSVCNSCIDIHVTADSKCDDCGPRCDKCLKPGGDEDDQGPCPDTCGFRQVTFQGEDTATKFCQWLFTEQHKNFKVIAHNLKGYDGYFLLEHLIDNSMRPGKIIYNGSKIMYMTVEKGLHIQVIDSLNFLPMKLAALPEAFGLKELKKGWFPHHFNRKENQSYVGSYPAPEFYGYNFMTSKERKEFLEWYQNVKDQRFDFRKEIKEYCVSDVDILRQACLKFRQLLISSTTTRAFVSTKKGNQEVKDVAIDPFDYVTIASVCMGVYKTKYLEEEWKVKLNGGHTWIKAKYIDGNLEVWLNNQWVKESDLNDQITERQFIRSPIAKVPPQGGQEETYSKASIQWLEWMAYSDGIAIQHALNGGEKRLPGTRYKLDGYCEATNTAYEYHGCVFHGCDVCFPTDRESTKHPCTGQSMSELYAVTLKKKTYIERLGMKYVCIWEHDFKEQAQKNPDLNSFIQNLDISDRLDPRDSFFGGRTNASQLYYKASGDEQIKYVDFTSLYPWVNKYCEYPTGHPEVITSNFKPIDQYFGIAKVKVLPPRGLYHPVLPYRSNWKLKFPLCRTCADQENENSCTCSDENRCLVGTWCTPELKTAIRLGYKVLRIYEVYHWTEKTEQLGQLTSVS